MFVLASYGFECGIFFALSPSVISTELFADRTAHSKPLAPTNHSQPEDEKNILLFVMLRQKEGECVLEAV